MTEIKVEYFQNNEECTSKLKKKQEAIQNRLFLDAKLKFNKNEIMPILVKFRCNDGSFGKQSYLYFFENNRENVEIGHDVIVPVIVDAENGYEVFKIARVESTFDWPSNGDWDFAINRIANFKDDNNDTEPRFIVLNLGAERDYAKNYHAAKEKTKKQKIALAKLEALVAYEDKMTRYKELAKTNPEIEKILKDLGEL